MVYSARKQIRILLSIRHYEKEVKKYFKTEFTRFEGKRDMKKKIYVEFGYLLLDLGKISFGIFCINSWVLFGFHRVKWYGWYIILFNKKIIDKWDYEAYDLLSKSIFR